MEFFNLESRQSDHSLTALYVTMFTVWYSKAWARHRRIQNYETSLSFNRALTYNVNSFTSRWRIFYQELAEPECHPDCECLSETPP